MASYAALLRGINVGGHKKVAMSDLREMAAAIGLSTPRTLLQSGNLVFVSRAQPTVRLERLLEAETKSRLGVDTSYLVRTVDEWREMMAGNPFPGEAESDPSHLVAMFCRDAPTTAAVRTLQAGIAGRERVRAIGRTAYIVYPDGMGTSKLTITRIERGLATTCTGRNWNTVLRIADTLSITF